MNLYYYRKHSDEVNRYRVIGFSRKPKKKYKKKLRELMKTPEVKTIGKSKLKTLPEGIYIHKEFTYVKGSSDPSIMYDKHANKIAYIYSKGIRVGYSILTHSMLKFLTFITKTK